MLVYTVDLTYLQHDSTWPAKTDLSACTGRWLRTGDTLEYSSELKRERRKPATARVVVGLELRLRCAEGSAASGHGQPARFQQHVDKSTESTRDQ